MKSSIKPIKQVVGRTVRLISNEKSIERYHFIEVCLKTVYIFFDVLQKPIAKMFRFSGNYFREIKFLLQVWHFSLYKNLDMKLAAKCLASIMKSYYSYFSRKWFPLRIKMNDTRNLDGNS